MKENLKFSKEIFSKKVSLLKTLLVGSLILINTSTDAQAQGRNKLDKLDSLSKNKELVKNSLQDNIIFEEEKSTNIFNFPENITFKLSHRLWAKDENGDLYINPWVILTPIQVEVGYEKKKRGKILIRVPYRYSRNFNTAEVVNEEEKEEIIKYIKEKLQKEFVEKLIFWDPTHSTRDVYRYQHEGEVPDLNKVKIESIKITGFSSPEGPDWKGKKTLAIGSVDKENVSLSGKRSSHLSMEIQMALELFDTDSNFVLQIQNKEAQFSETELEELENIAKKVGINNTSDNLESAYLLIKEYNVGAIRDLSILKALHEIIGTKRMVEVEITYQGVKKTKHVIPIPLALLILIPGIRWLKRETRKIVRERFDRTTTLDNNLLKERDLEKVISSDHPRFIELYNMTLESVEAKKNQSHIYERLIVDEFNPYLGTEEDDVGYMDMIKYASTSLDFDNTSNIFNNQLNSNLSPEEKQQKLERLITFSLLNKWEMNDLFVRFKKGKFTADELIYWQEPQKIMWAQEAMRNILRYGAIYRKEFLKGNNYPEEAVYKVLAEDVKALKEQGRLVPKRKKIRTAFIPQIKFKSHIGKRKGKYRKK